MNIVHTLIETLKRIAASAQFASLVYTTKVKTNAKGEITEGGETARHTVILGFSYSNLLEKSILELELTNVAQFAQENCLDPGVTEQAHAELLASLRESKFAHEQGEQNSAYTKAGMYAPIIAGLNVNLNDGSLQLYGLAHSKVVLQEGVRRKVVSSAKTIAKNTLRRALPIGKFREFAIDPDTAHKARIDGTTLMFE